MTKYRVHLEHDKSVVVEANHFYVDEQGTLRFSERPSCWLPIAFGPTRWVWVEEEKE